MVLLNFEVYFCGIDFRNRIEFCDGTVSADKVYSGYDEKTAVAWLWYV